MKIKKSNEQKNNLLQRLLTSTLKLKKDLENRRSPSPVYKFKYGLPKSFIKAVDNARMKDGRDVLPHLHRRSSSPSTHQKISPSLSSSSLSSQYQNTSEIIRASSTNDIDRGSTKKVPFRRKPREQQQQQQQRPSRTPMLVAPRPAFRMMMTPNFMMINRCPRPRNFMVMQPSLRMPRPRSVFPFRFR